MPKRLMIAASSNAVGIGATLHAIAHPCPVHFSIAIAAWAIVFTFLRKSA